MLEKIACVTVQFEKPEILETQMQCFVSRIVDYADLDFYVIDNSKNEEKAASVQAICHKYKINYERGRFHHLDGRDHQLALNHAFAKLLYEYNKICLLDHDIFPANEFNMQSMFDKVIAGPRQSREINGREYAYIFPGLIFLNSMEIRRMNLSSLVDFVGDFIANDEKTGQPLGLDSGGNLYQLISNLNESQVGFTSYGRVYDNDCWFDIFNYNKSCWIHYSNGSNWANHSYEEHERTLAYKKSIVLNPNEFLQKYT